jgi:excisionase family DNA binding protein
MKNLGNPLCEKLLSIRDVAEIMGVKESRVRAAIFRRELPFIKIGRLVRMKLEDIEAFLQKQRREAK